MSLTDRDAFANGYDWTAVYDAFGRRLQTACAVVLTNLEVEAWRQARMAWTESFQTRT